MVAQLNAYGAHRANEISQTELNRNRKTRPYAISCQFSSFCFSY